MNANVFDLYYLRSQVLKMTSEEAAERLGIRAEEFKNYEEKPQDIPFGIMMKISQEFGIPIEQVLNYKKPDEWVFKVENRWSRIEEIKTRINLYLAKVGESADEVKKRIIDIIKTAMAKYTAKPKVVLLGRSDSGKSTIINHLIGFKKLPTDWQPMTAILVYIKHIDDRPAYMGNDTVWIFRNDDKDQPWDDSRLIDEEYTKSLMVATGDEALLTTYGTREGEEYEARENKIDQISAAVLFVDSPILKCCDILDVPGFTGGRPSDEKSAEYASTKADILIYLSQSNSFLGKEDFIYLKGAIDNLPIIDNVNNPNIPKLANLFVVATQAHIIDYGDSEKVARILKSGCERFYSTLTENFWDTKTQVSGHTYTKEDLQKRFFSFTTDIKRLSAEFEESLRNTLEVFPDAVELKIIEALNSQKDALYCELAEKLKMEYSFRDKKIATESEYHKRIEEEPRIKCEFEEKRNAIISEISYSRSASKSDFNRRFNSLFNESNLVDMIKSRCVKNRKSSKEEFVAYLSSKLDEECKDAVMKEAGRLKPKFEQYTNSCQAIFDSTKVETDGIGEDHINSYNAKRAFVSGLSGAAAYGALAVWASTLGNLGGYIIVAKAVSLLATLGIHIGGTAAAIGTVSALGGPIAWGIGAAVLLGSAIFALFGGGWKKQFAKSICKSVKGNGTLSDCIKAIDKNWDDTEKAFNLGAANVVNEWDKQTHDLKNILENYDIDAIESNIRSIESAMEVLDNLPIYYTVAIFDV